MATQKRLDKMIFWPSIVVLAVVITPLYFNPQFGTEFLQKVFSYFTNQLGWLFSWSFAVALGFCGWLIFGRYKDVRLGDPGDKPEFSLFAWVSMLFCCGLAMSVLYWGTIEWAYYYSGPPFGIDARTPEAARWAHPMGLFHWGVSLWAYYIVVTIPIGYAYFNRKIPHLSISASCEAIIGKKHSNGGFGKFLDIMFIFGLAGGMGTSLGLNTPLCATIINHLFGIPDTFSLKLAIVLACTVIFAISVALGLKKGIARLSKMNAMVALGLVAYVFTVGPTAFIINNFTDGVSLMLQNFIRLSLQTDVAAQTGFPQGWTIFYWAWIVAVAPFTGLFIAKISKGRSMKEMVIYPCIFGSLGCWVIFASFGNTGLFYQITGQLDIVGILGEQGATRAILKTLLEIPGGPVLTTAVLIIGVTFTATTIDSSAYGAAAISTKDLGGNEDPPLRFRLVWSAILAAICITLLKMGGLKVLQTSSLVTALPLVFIVYLMMASFVKSLKEDQADIRFASPSKTGNRGLKSGRDTAADTGSQEVVPFV